MDRQGHGLDRTLAWWKKDRAGGDQGVNVWMEVVDGGELGNPARCVSGWFAATLFAAVAVKRSRQCQHQHK